MQNSLRMKYSRHHYHLFHLPANKIAIQASNWRIIKINIIELSWNEILFHVRWNITSGQFSFKKIPFSLFLFEWHPWLSQLRSEILLENFFSSLFFFSLFAKDLELVLAKFLPRQSKGVFVRSSLHAKTATNLEGN